MKLTRSITIIVISFSAFCLISCGNHQKEHNTTTEKDSAEIATSSSEKTVDTPAAKPAYKAPTPSENKFKDLRLTAFTTTPDELKTTVPRDKNMVYGVIIDRGMDDGSTTTLVSFITGSAGLYTTTGSIKNSKENDTAKKFVGAAQTYLDKAIKAHDTAVAAKGMVKFYLLTTRGIYVADEAMKNLTNHSSPLSQLFDAGNSVIATLK